MTEDFTPEQAAKLAEFEAAPYPAEVLLSHLRRPAAPTEPPAWTQQATKAAIGYRCCPHCAEDSIHDVPRDGHGLPCTSCLAARPSADTEKLRRVETLCAVWETEADSYSVADHRDKAVEARRRAKSLRAALDAR